MKAILNSTFVRFMQYLIRQFLNNGGIINASALTYTTLFAVVPLMTVTYAMLSAIPSINEYGDTIQNWIFENFVPTTGETIRSYLSEFTGQAKKLTGVGIGALVVTSIMMMRNIEVAFNRIWRVSDQRKGVSSFLLYWAVLSLGPILIGLGLVVTSYVATLPFVNSAADLVGKGRLLLLLPLVLSIIAFTLLYVAVPNCKVPLKNAFIGGLVVAILFESAKRGFAFYATQFPSYELIYGAFAAVPLFLFWIFISWVIILSGAELTRALTVYKTLDRTRQFSHLHTVVGILFALWKAQQEGKTLSDDVLLQTVPGLDQSGWDQYVQILDEKHLIKRADEGEYLLSRDLQSLSLLDLCDRLPWPIPEPMENPINNSGWPVALDQRLQSVRVSHEQALGESLDEMFRRSRSEGQTLEEALEDRNAESKSTVENRVEGSHMDALPGDTTSLEAGEMPEKSK
jgi:membrane protein